MARPNPRGQWVTTEVPELDILDEATWKQVLERLERMQTLSAPKQRRPKRLLSGLPKCGTCGGNFTITGRDRWGCSTSRETDTCSKSRSIVDSQLERRMFTALREPMLEPDAVAAYVEEYAQAIASQQQDRLKSRGKLEKQEAETTRRIKRLTLAIADGAKDFAEIRTVLADQVAVRERCRRELADIEAEPGPALMPNLAENYRRSVAQLDEALKGETIEQEEARQALRALIDHIVASPAEDRHGVGLEVRGRFAQVVRLATKKASG